MEIEKSIDRNQINLRNYIIVQKIPIKSSCKISQDFSVLLIHNKIYKIYAMLFL